MKPAGSVSLLIIFWFASFPKVRIVILNWNRAVGFDKICNEAKHHERSRNKSKELIICANRFSDPAIMMGDSAYHKYLTLVDITDLKLSSLVLLK